MSDTTRLEQELENNSTRMRKTNVALHCVIFYISERRLSRFRNIVFIMLLLRINLKKY